MSISDKAPDGYVFADKEIDDLIEKVVGQAAIRLPCLGLGGKDEVGPKLKTLIRKVEAAYLLGGEGCDGAWDTDGTFTVTVEHGHDEAGELTTSQINLRASLCLGEIVVG